MRYDGASELSYDAAPATIGGRLYLPLELLDEVDGRDVEDEVDGRVSTSRRSAAR